MSKKPPPAKRPKRQPTPRPSAAVSPERLVPAPPVPSLEDLALDGAVSHRDRIVDTLNRLEDLASILPEVVATLKGAKEFDVLLDFYGRVHDGLRTMTYLRDTLGRALIEIAPDRHTAYPVPGGGVFKIGGGRERKSYDQSRVVAAFAAALTEQLALEGVVTADGEVGDPGPVIAALVHTMAKATGATASSFTGWRTGVAREVGVNLNDYADFEDGPHTHRIEGRDP